MKAPGATWAIVRAMSIITGIYDVTDPALPVALKESDPLLITIAQ